MKVLALSQDVHFTTVPVGHTFWTGSHLDPVWIWPDKNWAYLKIKWIFWVWETMRSQPITSHQLCSFFFFFLLAVVLQAEPIPLVTSLKILFPWLKTRLVLFPQYLHDLRFLLNAGKMKCNWGLHVSQELSAMVGESLPTITAART